MSVKNKKNMFEVACDLYGDCVGSQFCKSQVAAKLLDLYDISEAQAEYVAQQSFDEWVEAYS